MSHTRIRSRIRHAAALLTVLSAALLAAACGGTDTAQPTQAPPDPARPPASVRWESWQGVKLPFGAKDGPAKTTTGAATGYSRTPQGAALAAIQHSVRIAIAPDSSWATIARTALADGPGKDAYVLNRALVSVKWVDPATAPRIAGYKVTAWSDTRAEVTVYTSYPDTSVLASQTAVTWVYKDWQLVVPTETAKTNSAVPRVPADAVALEAPR
ncbi:hypothetical protein [Nocardia brasiliensis]|uniref:hypothetical protein n=1 Tax=Nocardia brasiliensis TaxID=37326 RepID=UPI002458D70A|nr:hypothetical protein [Nocardia brasiliensis]